MSTLPGRPYSEHYIRSGNAVLYYYKTGNGPRALVAFHGFGQSHQVYHPWVQTLSGRYTFYLFDLYFHGKSVWNDAGTPLSTGEWKEIFGLFIAANKLEDITLAGFSLGGKFALATIKGHPEKVKHVYLLAPDGVVVNFWYRLATYPWLLRKLFNSTIDHPALFGHALQLAAKLRLADRSLLRFAENQMNTQEKRRRVYRAWVVFRRLHVPMPEIAHLAVRHGITILVVTGRYDRVITTQQMKPLLDLLPYPALVQLDTGHNGLIGAAAQVVEAAGFQ